MKTLFFSLALLFCLCLSAQPPFDLGVLNVQNVLETPKELFEESVGVPVAYEQNVVVYEVTNTYDNSITAIRCTFKDNILKGIFFGTSKYLKYWMEASEIKTFKRERDLMVYKTPTGVIYRADFSLENMKMQVLDIQKFPGGSTAIINYSVKE